MAGGQGRPRTVPVRSSPEPTDRARTGQALQPFARATDRDGTRFVRAQHSPVPMSGRRHLPEGGLVPGHKLVLAQSWLRMCQQPVHEQLKELR